jgi:hypothetical protein
MRSPYAGHSPRALTRPDKKISSMLETIHFVMVPMILDASSLVVVLGETPFLLGSDDIDSAQSSFLGDCSKAASHNTMFDFVEFQKYRTLSSLSTLSTLLLLKMPLASTVDSTLSPCAPAGHHANTAMAGAQSTAINWQCLAWMLFRAENYSFALSH